MAVFTVALWIVSGVLAVMMLMAGMMKALRPEKMQEKGKTMAEVAPNNLRAIGGAEVLGAIGIVLPPAIDILPWVAALAALGIATIQVLAMVRHRRNGEREMLPINGVILALALFVIIGWSGTIP